MTTASHRNLRIEGQNGREWSESESESENEKDEIRQVLKLSGGSSIEDCSSFSWRQSTTIIRIDDSVEIETIELSSGIY